ncbi:uncharacterized protein METZ01_LOCUS425514 [marine metagenome]|uniref:Uncharacterized protein n=1 Tax=marine metagenome TaxID=408172 RepID=A0A382XP97_9ZZZZ
MYQIFINILLHPISYLILYSLQFSSITKPQRQVYE